MCCASAGGRTGCPRGYFLCNTKQCLPESFRCDGVSQCRSGADERGCRCSNSSASFQCRSGRCVLRSALCNGVPNCEQADDELVSLCGLPFTLSLRTSVSCSLLPIYLKCSNSLAVWISKSVSLKFPENI